MPTPASRSTARAIHGRRLARTLSRADIGSAERVFASFLQRVAGARYLQKPYAMEDLARAVRNLVGSPGPLVIGPAAR
jgi:hypothetical protein